MSERKELEETIDDAARDFKIDHLYEIAESLEKNQVPNQNTDILKHLFKIREGQLELGKGQLDIKEKHEKLDSFLARGWKLIVTTAGFVGVVSYTIAVYHHESSLKPFIFDIVKAIFGKLGGV